MKYLIVYALSLLSFKLNAQTNFYKDSLLNLLEGKRYYLNDNKYSFKRFNPNNFQPKMLQLSKPPKTNDAGIVNLPKPNLVYIGNSNHSNIYQATPDKMYVIKPDSTFKSNMPVADIN